ncbi:hypothetical protein ACOMHN_003156 [Nucella lapillus]
MNGDDDHLVLSASVSADRVTSTERHSGVAHVSQKEEGNEGLETASSADALGACDGNGLQALFEDFTTPAKKKKKEDTFCPQTSSELVGDVRTETVSESPSNEIHTSSKKRKKRKKKDRQDDDELPSETILDAPSDDSEPSKKNKKRKKKEKQNSERETRLDSPLEEFYRSSKKNKKRKKKDKEKYESKKKDKRNSESNFLAQNVSNPTATSDGRKNTVNPNLADVEVMHTEMTQEVEVDGSHQGSSDFDMRTDRTENIPPMDNDSPGSLEEHRRESTMQPGDTDNLNRKRHKKKKHVEESTGEDRETATEETDALNETDTDNLNRKRHKKKKHVEESTGEDRETAPEETDTLNETDTDNLNRKRHKKKKHVEESTGEDRETAPEETDTLNETDTDNLNRKRHKKKKHVEESTGEDRETAPEETDALNETDTDNLNRKRHKKKKHVEESTGENRETAIEETDALDEIGDMEVAHVQEMTSPGEKSKKTTLCYICQANMSSKKEYIRHLARQHEKLSYQCPRCSRPLSSKSLMKHHMQTSCHMKGTGDSMIRPFHCQLCPLSYTSIHNMHRHFLCEHSVRKGVDFKCEHCGKPFSCLHRAKQHAVKCREGLVARSLREKTFECDFCHKMLASSSSRSHHVRSIHKNHVFHCICGKQFRGSSQYYNHRKACKEEMTVMIKGFHGSEGCGKEI